MIQKKPYKIILLFFFLFCLGGNLFAKPGFYTQIELNVQPVGLFSNHISLGGQLSLPVGLKFRYFNLGLIPYIDYLSLRYQSQNGTLNGSAFSLGSYLSGRLNTFSHFKLDLAAGAFWQRSAFQLDDSGWISKNKIIAGFMLNPELQFDKKGMFALRLLNTFNLEMEATQASIKIQPFYRLSLLFNISLLEQRIQLNGGGTFNVISHESIFAQENWTFLSASTGAKFKLVDTDYRFPPAIEKEKAKLKLLENAKDGDKIIFNQIVFKENSSEFTAETLALIKEMARIMRKHKELKFTIAAYAIYSGDPLAELQLAIERAKKLKQALVERKVPKENIQIASQGKLIQKDSKEKSSVSIQINKKQ